VVGGECLGLVSGPMPTKLRDTRVACRVCRVAYQQPLKFLFPYFPYTSTQS